MIRLFIVLLILAIGVGGCVLVTGDRSHGTVKIDRELELKSEIAISASGVQR